MEKCLQFLRVVKWKTGNFAMVFDGRFHVGNLKLAFRGYETCRKLLEKKNSIFELGLVEDQRRIFLGYKNNPQNLLGIYTCDR